MKKAMLLLAILSWLFTGTVLAETVRPKLEISARVWAYYLYDFSWYDSDYDPRSAHNGFNEFELDRAELAFTGWGSPYLSAELRAVTKRVEAFSYEDENGENQTVTPSNYGDFQLLIMHAFIRAHFLDYLNIRAGMIPEPWILTEEQAWPYRFIEDTLSQASASAWNEADIGLEILGDFPKDFGDYHLGIINGEGYDDPETNRYKAGFATIRLAPLAALFGPERFRLAYGVRYEIEDNPPGSAFRSIFTQNALALFSVPDRLWIGAEVYHEGRTYDLHENSTEQLGLSAFFSVRFVDRFWFLGRYDYYDFNLAQNSKDKSRRGSQVADQQLDSDEDAEHLALAGFCYDVASTLKVALTYRVRFWQQAYPDGPKKGDPILPQQIVKASLEFGF